MKPEEIGFPFTDVPERMEELIGQKLAYLSISISEKNGIKEPHVVWIKISNNVWHRFFIDVYYLHGEEFDDSSTTHELIKEDFKEFEDNGVRWSRRDLMMELQLENEVILDAVLTYGVEKEKLYALLSFSFEKARILLKDWGDELPQELSITTYNKN